MSIELERKQSDREFKVDVQMTSSIFYDYLIYHSYSSSVGIIGTSVGAIALILFLNSHMQNYLCLLVGIVFILYLPVTLKFQAVKNVKLNPVYSKPLSYTLNAEGITVSQGETTQTLGWDKFNKAVSTKQSILVYSGKNNATIFPRKQMEERLPELISTIAYYMDSKKVRIKY